LARLRWQDHIIRRIAEQEKNQRKQLRRHHAARVASNGSSSRINAGSIGKEKRYAASILIMSLCEIDFYHN
jgi:hypothetical protein